VKRPSPICKLDLYSSYNRDTQISFAENKLLRALISLSPLIAVHPKVLQHLLVRSSICPRLDRRVSCQRVGQTGINDSNSSYRLHPSLSLRLPFNWLSPAHPLYSSAHYTKGTQSHILLLSDMLLMALCCSDLGHSLTVLIHISSCSAQ